MRVREASDTISAGFEIHEEASIAKVRLIPLAMPVEPPKGGDENRAISDAQAVEVPGIWLTGRAPLSHDLAGP